MLSRAATFRCLKLMLAPGGIEWRLAENALLHSVTHGYEEGVALLVKKEVPEPLLVRVFQALVRTGRLGLPSYIETGNILLNLGVLRSILTPALLEICCDAAKNIPVEFIGLLVRYGADPMAGDLQCFIAAANKNDVACFEQLTALPFDLDLVVKAFINSIDEEDRLVEWIDRCLQRRSGAVGFQDPSLLLLVLERFSSGAKVLRQLTDHAESELQVADSVGLTPLCYATARGNTEAMRTLIEAGAAVDEGSLHIAARNLDTVGIKLLRAHGHDIYYPSPIFDGCPPLAELCPAAHGSGPRWESKLEAAIRELTPLLDHQWRSIHGKSIIHLAIDNPASAPAILNSLLRVSQARRSASRDEDYLYIDFSNDICYSPMQYVDRLCTEKTTEGCVSLVHLLKAHQFVDRYFAKFGAQPVGAVGLPKELEAVHNQEKQADWKQQQELRRLAVAEAQRVRLEVRISAVL